MEASDVLSIIAYGCARLLLAVIVLSILISLLIQAIRDLGLRGYFQKRWIWSWLRERATYTDWKNYADLKKSTESPSLKPEEVAYKAQKEIDGLGKRTKTFALSPGQLCGQISARAQSLLNEKRTTALMRLLDLDLTPDDESPADSKGEQASSSGDNSREARRFDRIERAIDDLQLYLDQQWKTFDYIAGAIFAAVLIGLSVAWAERPGVVLRGTPFSLWIVISVISSLLVPQVRPALERLIRSRA